MKFLYPIFIFPVILSFTEEAEYIEAPFQKYGVMLTQKKPGKFVGEAFPMVLFGEKFLCGPPSKEEIMLARNIIIPDISVLKERINTMPCLPWKLSQWTYVVCSNIIYRISNINFTQNALGTRHHDNYNRKHFGGFWGKGEKIIFTRHFTGDGICGKYNRDFEAVAWYFCRQSKEENVVFLQEISPKKYEIHIMTPRVCSDIGFESPTGYELHCFNRKDAMELLLENENTIESPRSSFNSDFLDLPKDIRGDIFFVRNSNILLKEENRFEKAPSEMVEEMCEKKFVYRADELMSTSMGIPFNFSVHPQNHSVDMVLYPFYRGFFNSFPLDIFENLKKGMRYSKKDKKK